MLPLFAGIRSRGAGLGPAIAFLYSGPAINVLAIILTARVLGWELGLARAVGAIVFAIVIGSIMASLYRAEESQGDLAVGLGEAEGEGRALLQTLLYFSTMVLILVIGLVFNRLDMFIDIAIAYAILNFIGNIAIAKYLDTRGYRNK